MTAPIPPPPAGPPRLPLPAEPGPDLEEHPGLRTAAAPRVVFTPVLSLSGQDIATDPDGWGPIALDGCSVEWGRDEALDQPTPATATVRLLDRTGTWAARRELIGEPINLAWTAVNPATSALVRKVFFRGRVTSAQLEPRSFSNTDNATVITLGASSILTDLANRVPFEAWPDETLEARRARVAAYTTAVASTVTVRTFWQAPHVAPVAAADQGSVLDSLTALYDSSGPDRLTYFPDDQRVYFLNRRDYATRAMAQLWWTVPGGGTTRDGKGAYARTIAFGSAENGLTGNQHYIDAADVESDGTMTKSIATRVTRVEVAHPDSSGTPAYTRRVETALVENTFETTQGVRATRQDSQLAWNSYAQTAANDLALLAGREGAGWSSGDLTFRADLADGFEYFDQAADLLLTGAELAHTLFLQRSRFAALDVRPCFGVIGGRITYEGGWQIEMNLLQVSTGLNKQHAISWEEIDNGTTTYELQWHDTDHQRGLHESLTYEDIGFVGLGLAVTAVPADTGFDVRYR